MVERKLVDIFSKNDVTFINSYYKAYPSKIQRPAIPLLVGSLPENEHVSIAESSLIMEYLMEEMELKTGSKSSLEPSSAFAKSQVGIFVHAVNREIFPCINSILNSSNLERLEKAVDRLMEALGCIETMLKRSQMEIDDSSTNKYFLGSNFSLAEAKAAPCFQRLLLVVPKLRPELASVKSLRPFGGKDTTILFEMVKTRFPATAKWLSAVLERPSVQTNFHAQDITEVLSRARVNKFDMPALNEDQ
eukprot:14353369-Ditylum_brightwellii.AAC.1